MLTIDSGGHIAGVKILIDQHLPFQLAHGGANTQVEQTKLALERAGAEVEFLRWWDESQNGDLIHFFGCPPGGYLNLARLKRLPVITNILFTDTCNRSLSRLKRQGLLVKTILSLPFGEGIKSQLNWRSFQRTDHNVVGLAAEKIVLQVVYGVPAERVTVVPYGLSETFLRAGAGPRNEPHLICTGTITPRKCSVELAQLAHAAQVPVLFLGKPYHESEPYFQKFRSLVDGKWVRHQSHVRSETEMVQWLQAARGFVLMSWYENWCLSAHEAAACGLPLLLTDQNWSRERFGRQVRFFEKIGFSDRNVQILRKFWQDSPTLRPPEIKLHSWQDVGGELLKVYGKILARPA